LERNVGNSIDTTENVGNGIDTAETVTKYYRALGRLIAFRKNGTLYWAGTDHLGGTVRVMDASFNPTGRMRYSPYGVSRDPNAAMGTDHLFTGQISDGSTGLYWYGSRAYDPACGRFTCPDSIVPSAGNPQALNRYAYTANNPLKFVDPSGHSHLPWIDPNPSFLPQADREALLRYNSNLDDDSGGPFVIFVGGMFTGNSVRSNAEAWGTMMTELDLSIAHRGTSYDFFDWGAEPIASSGTVSLAEAARRLNRQIGSITGKSSVILIGHSRGGALVMEYAKELANGLLHDSKFKGIYSIDGALSRLVTPPADARYSATGVDFLADLPARLGKRGLGIDLATFDNKADYFFTTHDPIPGVQAYEYTKPGTGNVFEYPQNTHGVLQRDRDVARLIHYRMYLD
jgi:RHS repeat-associated protein